MTLSGFRWAMGHISAAALDETYAIENFPLQADGVPWYPPKLASDLVLDAALEVALSGALRPYGGREVLWTFPWWSSLMIAWVRANRFNGLDSQEATIRIPGERLTGSARTFQCLAHWPKPEVLRGLKPVGDGLEDFPIAFVLGQEVF